MNKKQNKVPDFQVYLRQQLKDSEFRRQYEEFGKQLELAYEIQLLRKQHNMSQADLARKIGTRQSNVARMEKGEQNLTTETLQRVASAFGRELKIEFIK